MGNSGAIESSGTLFTIYDTADIWWEMPIAGFSTLTRFMLVDAILGYYDARDYGLPREYYATSLPWGHAEIITVTAYYTSEAPKYIDRL